MTHLLAPTGAQEKLIYNNNNGSFYSLSDTDLQTKPLFTGYFMLFLYLDSGVPIEMFGMLVIEEDAVL